MMAAVQPFISGAISKTINMPEETTVEQIHAAYMESWRLGLKAVALYRDGCKRSQPLSASSESRKEEPAMKADDTPAGTPPPADSNGNGHSETPAGTTPVALPKRERMRLPKKRRGMTHEARIGINKVYLRTGEYPDGRLGEIFIDMHKEGASFRSIMNCFAISVSLGLQHGVPLEEYVDAFTFTRFDPQGPVDHPNIKFATSIIDYIFRLLGLEYLGRTDFVQVKPADTDQAEEKAVELLAAADAAKAERQAAMGQVPGTALEKHMKSLMGDAPFCDTCGHLTVRNGTCYKCLNCGATMGCS
jgi:ribonucleoside-diphosphate reductase alpha chain